MWIEALDLIFTRMQQKRFDFTRVKGISGSGQQHASVYVFLDHLAAGQILICIYSYWSEEASDLLENLDTSSSLLEQLCPAAFAHPWSPNWQDHSTIPECQAFENHVGGADILANISGSKAHHVCLALSKYKCALANSTCSVSLGHKYYVSESNSQRFTRPPRESRLRLHS